jgi:hypothetical protein
MIQKTKQRLRRGKVVDIPEGWRGKVTTPATIRQRPSKLRGKLKRIVKDVGGVNRYKDAKDIPLEE